jgi:hypothetical protein
MRWARSYSIVDHQLLHGKYLHCLTHQGLALYLFLVVVSDKDGKSFYKQESIMKILRMSRETFATAFQDLLRGGLIHYRAPNFYINNLTENIHGRSVSKDPLSERHPKAFLSPNPAGDWHRPKEVLPDLLRQLAPTKTQRVPPE